MSEPIKESIFDDYYDPFLRRRKDMLPGWLKVGCWVFLALGVVHILGVAFVLLSVGVAGNASSGTSHFSVIDIAEDLDAILKAVVAFALLREKDFAIKLGLVQGIITLILSLSTIVTHSTITTISGAGETTGYSIFSIIVVAYIARLYKLKGEWEANAYVRRQILNPSES